MLATLIFTWYRELSGKYEKLPAFVLIIGILLHPIVLLYALYEKIFPKRFVHYFDKTDTPYSQEFQPKSKYHKVWKRLKYKTFFGHKVIKIRWFDLITIYDKGKVEE